MKLTFAYILFILIAFNSRAFAQKAYVTLPEASKKITRKYEKAKTLSITTETEKKKSKLEAIISSQPILIDAIVDLAKVFYIEKDYDKSVELMTEALENAPGYEPEYFNILAGICKAKEDYACEKKNLLAYIDNDIPFKRIRKAKIRLEKIRQIEMINENAQPVEIEKMSFNINSEEYAEYKPVLSTNDSTMIFTRRVNGQEDFYESNLSAEGWSIAQPVTSLNTLGNEGAHAVSPDGKYIIFTRCDAPKRYRSCDLYISSKKDGEWNEPKFMGITNTDAWESQAAFSPDGKTIYFSSGREGGLGNKDLYQVSNVDGQWGTVQNMGDVLNTKGNEESPYIHPDGRTIYFMSTGHVGLGGYDLFMSRLQADGSWMKPKNMGPSINSTEDEGGIFVDVAGKYAYFSKTEKTEEKLISDIYRFELPLEFKPVPVSYINIKVRDSKTKQALAAVLTLREVTSDVSRGLTIPKTGLTEIIAYDKPYELIIEKEGYVFYSENINPLLRSFPTEPVIYNIDLQAIPSVDVEESEEMILRNIQFGSGTFTLRTSSYNELNKLVEFLKKEDEQKIIIFGHTDNVGNVEDNLLLSQNRANAVKDYLVEKGISITRVQTKALGESQAIATNETEEGREKNRRISFKLL